MKTFLLPGWNVGLRYHDLPGEGLPILFIHGLGCASSCDYPRVAADPALLRHRRILVDLLGSGFSDQPHDFPYTVEAHAECIQALIEGLGLQRLALFGHSMGGAVAIVAARLCPGRIEGLVLGEPNLVPGGGAFSRAIAARSESAYLDGGHEATIQDALAGGNGMWGASMRRSCPQAVHRGAVSLVEGSSPTWKELLEGFPFPRTVLFGEWSLPDPDFEHLAASGVPVRVVEAAGHSMAWENPSGLARAIRSSLAEARDPGGAGPASATEIRPAHHDDLHALGGLCLELGYRIAEAALGRNLEHLLGDPAHAVFVAEVEGAVAGWIHVREGWSLESGPQAELAGLVVEPMHRNQGLGAKLVAEAEAWARARGLARIRVRSRIQREDAHRFYRRLGYAESKIQTVLDKDL